MTTPPPGNLPVELPRFLGWSVDRSDGSSSFGMFPTQERADQTADKLRSYGNDVVVQPSYDDTHRYLSTACVHGQHDYCASMTGYQGEKRPATCKFCDAHCRCDCHTTTP